MPSQRMWQVAHMVSGGTVVGLGVLGLFLAFLQGMLFRVVGLTLLVRESLRLRNGLMRFRSRLPYRVSRSLDALCQGGMGNGR